MTDGSKRFWIGAIAASLMAATAATPAAAAPALHMSAPVVADGNVDLVQWRQGRDRRDMRRWQRRGNNYYYNGHRGYRQARPGYRQYNGWWFPSAAFVAGAIIGGAANAAPAPSGNAHVNWCANRYRSYDVRSNTFQPYNGPRRQCVSPYR